MKFVSLYRGPHACWKMFWVHKKEMTGRLGEVEITDVMLYCPTKLLDFWAI